MFSEFLKLCLIAQRDLIAKMLYNENLENKAFHLVFPCQIQQSLN